MNKYHFWPEEVTNRDGLTTISCTVESPNNTKQQLWYRFPEQYYSDIALSCDPFIIALIFNLMKQKKDVIIHGEVSPFLLQNLAEYQGIWHLWRPNVYHPVEIRGEVEKEISVNNCSDATISAFSGGVDSCFTIWQHHTGICGRWQRNIKVGLMIQGFDIPLSKTEEFERAVKKSTRMLGSLGVECVPLSTNIRQFGQYWLDSFASAVISCLMLFQKTYKTGLIPSGSPYDDLIAPWGSHPITDPLLSNKNFSVVLDGLRFSRVEKIEQISSWKEATEELRVCSHGKNRDRNCGKCEKCIRTMLSFRAVGSDLPQSFESGLSNQKILSLSFYALSPLQIQELKRILKFAYKNKVSDIWVQYLKLVIFINQITSQIVTPELKNFSNKYFPKLVKYYRKIRGYN